MIPISVVPFTSFQVVPDRNGGSLITGISASGTMVSPEGQRNAAIAAADAAISGNYTITLSGTITEGTDAGDFSRYANTLVADPLDLFGINLHPGVTLNFGTFNDLGEAIDGAGLYRGLFVYAGNVTLQDLKIQNTVARGGTGGDGAGGGAGLGGALFVAGTNSGLASGGTVTIGSYVTLTNNSAIGGAGGGFGGYGGGGGLGGSGGSQVIVSTSEIAPFSYAGGGGGIGAGASGGTRPNGGRTGIILGAAGGYSTTGYNNHLIQLHSAGGAYGGGGGSNGGEEAGGGGVAGAFNKGGFGGYKGGEGDYSYHAGGGGGFGGGGGREADGGFGGGAGGFDGGGGLGAGGNIFVQQGGSLIPGGNDAFNNGTVTGGLANPLNDASNVNGSAYGSGVFLQGNETIGLEVNPPLFTTIADDVTDAGSGAAGLILEGNRGFIGGGVELDGTVNLGGGLTIQVGGVRLQGSITPEARGLRSRCAAPDWLSSPDGAARIPAAAKPAPPVRPHRRRERRRMRPAAPDRAPPRSRDAGSADRSHSRTGAGQYRWTDGDALLPLMEGAILVEVQVTGGTDWIVGSGAPSGNEGRDFCTSSSSGSAGGGAVRVRSR